MTYDAATRPALAADIGSPVPARSIPKVNTGIEGLDRILDGGLPAGRTTIVGGGPGTGKTIFGLEFLYRGALNGEPGLHVSFEERPEAVRANALAMGWDLAALEGAGRLFLVKAELPREAILTSGYDLAGMLAVLAGKARAMGARRIVLDAVDVLMRVFRDPLRVREQYYALHDWLREQQLTGIMTVKTSQDGEQAQPYLGFMADCVIYLDQRVAGQVRTRRLQVVKYRGSGFLSNEYPYVIGDRGVRLIPVSTVSLRHRHLEERISAGTAELDAVTGGGFRRGTTVMIGGISGTGKTTLACTFVRAACARGERVLYVDFEESEEALVAGMLGSGIDLRPALAAGALRVLTAMPESLGVEEHLVRILDAMDALDPDHVVVDAVSATARMGSEVAAFDFMVRLLHHCKDQGVTCILANQTRGGGEVHEVAGQPIASLVDVGIGLGYLQRDGRLERRLLVIKARGAAHSLRSHKLEITSGGLRVAVGTGGTGRKGTGRRGTERKTTRGKATAAGEGRRPRAGGKA